MRIIGGRLKGRTIDLPSHYPARPTTDFAREALFNILDNEYEFEGLKVLDLFGGTGAISYEFASRGAARVYCIEMNRSNAAFIRSEAWVWTTSRPYTTTSSTSCRCAGKGST